MKLLYMTNVNLKGDISYGILKKIFGQVNAFDQLGYDVDLYFPCGNDYILYETDRDYYSCYGGLKSNSIINTLKRKSAACHLSKIMQNLNYDVLYVRFSSLNINTLFFLRSIQGLTKCVILEIPTYPYIKEKYIRMQEPTGIKQLKFIKYCFIDFVVRTMIKNFLHFIVLTIPKKRLWGIPVVSIENGIDYNKVVDRKRIKDKKTITLFAVTLIEEWQGLDRLVYGIHNYVNKKGNNGRINCVIAGDGPVREKLKSLVQKLHLENSIIFCGKKSGKALDALYDQADIAIGSLGRHRHQANAVSTLKTKEYCAKGIPFIYSNDEPTLNGKESFALKVPADDSAIDIDAVIMLYNRMIDNSEVTKEMKKLARERYDWIHQIRTINDKIQYYLS